MQRQEIVVMTVSEKMWWDFVGDYPNLILWVCYLFFGAIAAWVVWQVLSNLIWKFKQRKSYGRGNRLW